MKSISSRNKGIGRRGSGDLEAGPAGTGSMELPRAAALVRTRVEPKTFFAGRCLHPNPRFRFRHFFTYLDLRLGGGSAIR